MNTISLADDLTGAAEIGNCFASAGFTTQISLQNPRAYTLESLPEAVIFNTDSRNLSLEKAQQELYAVTEELRGFPPGFVYKKIDSTLRGNIGVETETVLHGLGKSGAVLAPAFPAQGRTTVTGRQLLHGVPVSETAIGRDPLAPVADASIPALLRGQIGEEAALIRLDEVEAGTDALAESLIARLTDRRYCVVDAVLEDHLDILAQALVRLGPDILHVGTTGLAKHLARHLRSGLGSGARSASSPSFRNGSVLIVCGSRDAVSLEQLNILTETLPVARVKLQPNEGLKDDDMNAGRLQARLSRGDDVALYLDPAENSHVPARRLAEDFAEFVGLAFAVASVRGLVLIGGQTAHFVLEKLRAKALIPCGQIAEGVPIMHVVGGVADGISVITKGGGIGNADVLLQAVAPFRSGKPRHV